MRLLISLSLAIASFQVHGQSLIEQIAGKASSGEVGQARALIDSAMQGADSNNIAMWYFQGYVYKELYKKNQGLEAKKYGDVAIRALTKCMQAEGEENADYTSQSERLLVYLLGQYFNEAAVNISARSYEIAQSFFQVYEEYMALIDTRQLQMAGVKFYKLLASTYALHAAENSEEAIILYRKAIEANEHIMVFNEESFYAHYNIGSLSYTLSKIDDPDVSTKWLDKALLYLKKAEVFEDGRGTEAAKALLAVYREVGNTEMVKEYEEKLKDAEK